MGRQGLPLDPIQKQLVHKDLRMTSRYGHAATQQVQDAVNILNPILTTLKAPEKEMAGEKNRSTRLN
jgi:integrase